MYKDRIKNGGQFKMKKFITLALSFLIIGAAVGCSNKDKNQMQSQSGTTNEMNDQAYYNTYTGLYNESIGTLGAYDMYTDVNTATNAYKNKEYPGNEKYLSEVKAAYKDSRDKIQTFVNGLKKDVDTGDTELKQMNKDLISQGEKLIKDIDTKLVKLDEITEADYNKTQDEFIKLVHDTVQVGDNVSNDFTNMLKNIDKKLGIDRNTIQNNNMNNTTK